MALKDFIRQQYYGNPNQAPKEPPHTRIELFKTVFSVRKGRLTTFSLISILAWLPAVVWSLITILQLMMAANGSDTYDTALMQQIAFTYTLVMAPLTAITGPFTMAASYVMRNWARDEHADLAFDYRSALKTNWKQGLMYGITNGIMIPLAYTALRVYLTRAGTYVIYYVPVGFILVLLLIWQLCRMVIPMMCVTYSLPYRHIIRNAFYISIVQLPRAIGIWLLSMIVPILTVLFCALRVSALIWALPFALIYFALFGYGFNRLIYASYANMVCEKYINSRIDGAPTDIGLH